MPLITDSLGRVLGRRYRLVSPLGSGASAHVYKAEDLSLERVVAVKVLQPGLAEDQGFLKRFRAEARAVASLNHPHVLRVFDWGEDADGPYLVLEYLGGGSLRDLLNRGYRLSHAQAATVGAQAAQGLAYAHSRGIVHRDVKPANLLFDEDARVRVADFGVARALAEAAWTEPVGGLIGTARYAAPEQLGGQLVDGRADVYGLALVLYEALTGEPAFTGGTPMETLMVRVGAPLPHHDALGPLDDVLARAAAPEREARPDAAALASRLGALAASLPAPAPLPLQPPGPEPAASGPGARTRPLAVADPSATGDGDDGTVVIPAPSRAGEVFDVEALEPAGPGVPQRRRRRRRWPWPWVLVAGVVVVAAGAAAVVQEKVFVPSHRVPDLAGMTLATAASTVERDQFDLVTSARVYSIGVAAGRVVTQRPAPPASLKQGSHVVVVVSKGPPPVGVPALGGLDCDAATRLLAELHLKASCPPAAAAYSSSVPQGEVINWSYDNVLDAKHAPYGSTIEMAVSKGPQPVAVPSVVDDTYAQAQSALSGAGLVAAQGQGYSTTVPAGEAIGTTPAAGADVLPGSTVTVIVSQGPPIVPVPNLIGDSVAQAQSALSGVGLGVGAVYGPSGGTVFTTIPGSGASEPEGTAVDLYTE